MYRMFRYYCCWKL